MKPLPAAAFYQQDAVTLARALLGKLLVHVTESEGESGGVIVETEAYAGQSDAACHSYKRAAPAPQHRTNVMFGPGGCAYVYMIYGMYNCFNVVANREGCPEAVLVRALAPTTGIALMQARRGRERLNDLCSGPGKLCTALAITRAQYGADLRGSELYILDAPAVPDEDIVVTPRINVNYAGADALLPYRFLLKDSPYVSKPAIRKQ